MPPLYYFIVNPKSGSNVDISVVRHLRDHLRSRGRRIHLELTRSLEHAGDLTRDAIRAGAAAVVVAGGDGTVRVVADATAETEMPILIIPCGTENLLACELGLDGTLETSRLTLEQGLLRKLDLGQANDRHFMAIAGVGFDAEVVRRVHAARAGHITPVSYIWPICRTFWEYPFPTLRVVVDGQEICNEPALVFVSNIARYAIGLGLSPEADFSDGYLDICIYKTDSRRRLMGHSLLTVLKSSHKSNRVVRRRCKYISIDSPDPRVPVQLDGDPGPALPLDIQVIPAAARVLTPPPPESMQYHPPVRYYHLRRWLLR